jgi:hypothetical protein
LLSTFWAGVVKAPWETTETFRVTIGAARRSPAGLQTSLRADVRTRDKRIQNRDKSTHFLKLQAHRLRGAVFLLRLRDLPAFQLHLVVGISVAVYVRLEFIREVV